MAKKVVYDGIIFDCGKDLADYLGVSADTIYSWLSDPKMKPPQNIVEKGIGYYGDSLIQEGYKRRPPHTTTICEGKIFKTGKECAKHYNINPSTMTKWLNGTNPMPQEWIEKGLNYYDSPIEHTVAKDIKYLPGGDNIKAKKVICEGIVYDSIAECAAFYNINPQTMRSWFWKNGNKMPLCFQEKGLKLLT